MNELLVQWANHVLVWIGFGAVIGLLSKAILPGKDPGGTFATIVIGIFGAFIGAASLYFFTGEKVSPLSIVGFLVGVGGSALLLITYRLLSGRAFPRNVGRALRWRRGGRRRVVVEE
ncbi:MAG: GlsB/YeaQ/YmgE family stress response membrane protein [Gemmataceae bacterium]|nr:GlsB/YeaQ/YmgE family stress response membrane protein [Gemmataceae bacterium]